MTLPTIYTFINLNNDAVSLSKSLKDAISGPTEQQRKDAWYDTAMTSAKITAGMAELAASNPQWAGLLGSSSTLTSLGVSARRISADPAATNDINVIKAGDILSVVGGISDLAGNLLIKPGPILVAGLTLKGAGTLAGVAQNVVGDQTIGQLMGISADNNNAPLVPPSLFDYAPDGVTPLNTMVSTQVGNNQAQVYWSRDASAQFTKNESISSMRSDGTLMPTNFTQYQYSSSGKPLSAIAWLYGPDGALKYAGTLLPSADGKSWVNALDGLITAMQTEFGIAQTTQSPLILDLDGDGVETIGTGAGVHFDHDGNRFGELSGWVGKDDGLLVWDRNGNGQIDSGTELFGNNTVLANGQKAANGFAALGDLDANRDGKMDTTDAAFANLRVWKDGNSNAVVDAGEFQTLTQAGVRSITTAFVGQAVTDANGNQHLQAGTFMATAGTVRVMNDVWFSADTARLTVCDAAKTRTRKVATKSIAWHAYGSSAKGRFYAKKWIFGRRRLTRVTSLVKT